MVEYRALTRAVALCALCGYIAASCGETDPAPAVPPVAAGGEWEIASEPSLVIGREGDPDYEFTRIVGAGRLDSGRYFVFDQGPSELRIYSENGDIVGKFGGRGSGPGEFRDVSFAQAAAGDTLLIFDRGLARLTSVTGRLKLIGTWQARATPDFAYYEPAGVWNGTSVVWSALRRQPCVEGSLTHDALALYSPGADWNGDDVNEIEYASLALLGVREGGARFGLRGPGGQCISRVVPFMWPPLVATHAKHVYIAANDRLHVVALDAAGNESTIVDSSLAQPDSLTAGHIEKYIELITPPDQFDQRGQPIAPPSHEFYETMRSLPYPENLPINSHLRIDEQGYIWISKYRMGANQDAHWWVFNADGRLATTLAAPANLSIVEVGTGHVVGVHSDEDTGVQTLQVHELRRR